MTGAPTWRLIDTGLRCAAENIAINKAMLEARAANEIPNTLRFLQFTPCALLGFHQSVEQELRADYCAAHDIPIQRRVSGGGALYCDATQIGWELYLDRKTVGTGDMMAIASRICQTIAQGVRALGVDAQFRPRNDIEVNGKKIAGTGGVFDGNAILYHGTLLVDFDVAQMLRVLRIPAEKLSDKAIASARERVANLKDLLGAAPSLNQVKASLAHACAQDFGIEFEEVTGLSTQEQVRFDEALCEIDTPEWVYQHNRPLSETPFLEGIHKSAGGLVRAAVTLDVAKGRIKQVWFTGDFFVNPRRCVADLEAVLRDTARADASRIINTFFAQHPADMVLLTPADFIAAINLALDGATVATLKQVSARQ